MNNTQDLILSSLNNKNYAISHEVLTVTSLISLTVPVNANYALLTVEASTNADGIRFWVDGTAPTSTDGILRKDGSGFDIKSLQNLRNFRAIGVNAGAIVQVQYYT